jgi:hypothetical protein
VSDQDFYDEYGVLAKLKAEQALKDENEALKIERNQAVAALGGRDIETQNSIVPGIGTKVTIFVDLDTYILAVKRIASIMPHKSGGSMIMVRSSRISSELWTPLPPKEVLKRIRRAQGANE